MPKTDKQKPSGTVYVVSGLVDYEGSDVIAIVASKKLVKVAIDADKAVRRVEGRWAYDSYDVQKMKLDTRLYASVLFGTARKVTKL